MSMKFSHVTAAALCAMTGAVMAPSFAMAEVVTLSASDGSVSITGNMLGLDEGFYIVETALGTMRVDAEGVVCEGEGCPVLAPVLDVHIAGSSVIGDSLMEAMIVGQVSQQGGVAEVERNVNDEHGHQATLINLIADEGYGDEIGHFAVEASDTDDGLADLLEGEEVQIAMSSRRIRPAEARRFASSGAGNMISPEQERVIAVDSLVVIVNPQNEASSITMADLDGIFSGRITNWSELGGRDVPIVAFGREEGSGSGSVFGARIFEKSGRRLSADVQTTGSNQEMIDAVNAEIGGIGFVGFAFQEGTKHLAIGSDCGIVAHPDAFTAKAEEYPLGRRLYLYNRADTTSIFAQEFLDFSISPDADDVISKAGFIGLGVLRASQASMSGRLGDMITNTVVPAELPLMRELAVDMLQFDRLSTTFRFASGSAQIEAKSLVDLGRLVSYLGNSDEEIEIALVGFSDSDGSFAANQSLSASRAQLVADAIQNIAGDKINSNVLITARGYGELAPSACNTSLDGKRINRRVEVWIRSLN